MREIAKETIEKAAGGDMYAFEEIYRTFSSIVYNIAFNITRNRQDAEETTQDVFIKIFKNLKDFKFESSFGTWVYRITMNTAINIYKTGARHKQRTAPLDEIGELADPASGSPKDALEQMSAESRVAEMLKYLSPEHRSCIVLRELEGLDYKEIAGALGIPLNTVRSRLKRAREALIVYCKKDGVGYGL